LKVCFIALNESPFQSYEASPTVWDHLPPDTSEHAQGLPLEAINQSNA